jgi:antitoxin component of MazEF toxin-antitoxin module
MFLRQNVTTFVTTWSYFCDMNKASHHTNIINVGNSKGIRIPKDYLATLGKEVVLEKTAEGVLIRPAHHVVPLKEWDKLFAVADTTVENEFNDWDITLEDGIE